MPSSPIAHLEVSFTLLDMSFMMFIVKASLTIAIYNRSKFIVKSIDWNLICHWSCFIHLHLGENKCDEMKWKNVISIWIEFNMKAETVKEKMLKMVTAKNLINFFSAVIYNLTEIMENNSNNIAW